MTYDLVKVSALGNLAAPTRDDLLYLVNEPGGAPASYRSTLQAVVGGPALLIAASDAGAAAIKKADYVCDGTDDDVQIQAAIDALPAIGGTIQLSAGTFNLTAPITFPAKPLCFTGSGSMAQASAAYPSVTVLAWTLAGVGDCITIAATADGQSIERLELAGDAVNTRYGIYLASGACYKSFRDVAIRDMAVAAVKGDSGNSQNYFERVKCLDNLEYGFSMYGICNRYVSCQAGRGAGLGAGGVVGFMIHEGGTSYVGCTATRYTVGFYVSGYAESVSLFGCHGEQNIVHVQISASAGVEPKATTVIGFLGADATSAILGAFVIGRSFGVLFLGCHVKDSASDITYDISALAEVVTIQGGYTNDATPVQDVGGTRVSIHNVHGYVAQNQGAAAAVADGGTIAHGLSGTPTVALVSGSLASEFVSVTGIGAANITVAIKKHDGSAGTAQTIYWRAWV